MKNLSAILLATIMLWGCDHTIYQEQAEQKPTWKQKFDNLLPLLGHRNWVLVVDKAFPQQNSPGIRMINTGENLVPVLQYVIGKMNESTHVRPVFYKDAELDFLDPEIVPGLKSFRESAVKALGDLEIKSLLHDSVFVKIDAASRLFTILILKTEETIPYTSVFINLDCKYWSPEYEAILRQKMKLGK